MRKGSLTQAGRTVKQDMVQCLSPHHSSFYIYRKLFNDLLLTVELGKVLGPYLAVKVLVLYLGFLPRIVIFDSHTG